MLNEIKVVFNAASDHLVAFYDAFFHDGAVHLALEYMDCGSLEVALRVVGQTQARVLPEARSRRRYHEFVGMMRACVAVASHICTESISSPGFPWPLADIA